MFTELANLRQKSYSRSPLHSPKTSATKADKANPRPTPTTDALIKWFWERFGDDDDGLCQCGTERLISRSGNPNQLRSFLMISVFIDQLVSKHFIQTYPQFRDRFRFPKLYAHGVSGMMGSSWLVYSRHGYDKKMNWETARPIALQLFNDCLKFLAAEINSSDISSRILGLAEDEARMEFEMTSEQAFLTLLSSVRANFGDDHSSTSAE